MGQQERRNNPIIFVFHQPASKKERSRVNGKKNHPFSRKCVNFKVPIILLPLVNDVGQASTL